MTSSKAFSVIFSSDLSLVMPAALTMILRGGPSEREEKIM